MNEEEVKILRDIVGLREFMLSLQQRAHAAGQVADKDLVEAEIELANARIRLARAEHKTEDEIQLLKDLVTVLQENVEELKRRHSEGSGSLTDVREAQIELAETRLRLLAATGKT
jgi:outer membrane protein TolC